MTKNTSMVMEAHKSASIHVNTRGSVSMHLPKLVKLYFLANKFSHAESDRASKVRI